MQQTWGPILSLPLPVSYLLCPLENDVSAGEYMTFDSKATSRKSKEHMVKAVSPASADVASEKTRVPIYFSKKMSKLAQVRFPSPRFGISHSAVQHAPIRFMLTSSSVF